MHPEFVPMPPPGFDIAGSFDGVTTAVGQAGTPAIRYELKPEADQPWTQEVARIGARYTGRATARISSGMLKILVTDCDTEDECRQVLRAALVPYLETG